MPARTVRFSTGPLALMICLVIAASPSVRSDSVAIANDKAQNKPENQPERQFRKESDTPAIAELKVTVRDSQGSPVSGATLQPYALRVQEIDGHGIWDDQKEDPRQLPVTDRLGQAMILYPASVVANSQVLTPRLISFIVSHPEFIQKSMHAELGPAQADVTLEAGCEVQIGAVDAAGKPVSQFAVVMSGPFATDQWTSNGQDGRRTRALKSGTWQTMLVSLPDQGPALFSNVMPLAVLADKIVKVRYIRLLPGARLRGTLAANIPRPVRHGRVIVNAVPKPAGASSEAYQPSVVWNECRDIDGQGNFEFPSLPRGGNVQIIAICDGWMSKTIIPLEPEIMTGQLFPLDSLDKSITVEMEPSGILEVTVNRTDGSPVAGAKVVTSPNQSLYKGGTALLGDEVDSRNRVTFQLTPLEQRKRTYRGTVADRYTETTDKQGKATIKGIPLGRFETITVFHPEYELTNKDNRERHVRYHTVSADPLPLELIVQKIKK
jgi:hypothetical protein